MSSPQAKFILSSDYATLKNDSDVESVSVTIPSSISVPSGTSVQYTQDLVIGQPNAPMMVLMSSSFDNRLYSCDTLSFNASGIVDGLSYPYGYRTFVYRLNNTTVRLIARIYNATPFTLTGESTSRTVTAYIRTFRTPFD